MIYDCFIFNKELDLLELRLEFLYPFVDKFVIVESSQTLSGGEKPLYFLENSTRFDRFKEKIIHVICPKKDLNTAWDFEYYQRDYIRTALISCVDDDIIVISDVDEIVNLPDLLSEISPSEACLVEIPVSYYFFNLTSDITFAVNLITPYQKIKNCNIGNRDTYTEITKKVVNCRNKITGWHFSFLFGHDIELYQNKIKSFSHQEFNSEYYLQPSRIKRCVSLGIDIFERTWCQFYYRNPNKVFTNTFSRILEQLDLKNKYIYDPFRNYRYFFSAKGVAYLIKYKHSPRLRRSIAAKKSNIKSAIKNVLVDLYSLSNKVRQWHAEKDLQKLRAAFYTAGDDVYIEKPYKVINPEFISIGQKFFALYNLRLEALSGFGEQRFSPRLFIGDNVTINTDCHIGCINQVEIGNNVLIASRVFISDHSHGEVTKESLLVPPNKRPLISKGGIIIEDDVWIGEGASILPGVHIGKGSIIGANAVVTKNVPANCVAAGNPARVIKSF